ncbi:hypothetical protein O9929_01215 [Vibrio lentus]|nr:hypothetical protein [Vibrio lentus]
MVVQPLSKRGLSKLEQRLRLRWVRSLSFITANQSMYQFGGITFTTTDDHRWLVRDFYFRIRRKRSFPTPHQDKLARAVTKAVVKYLEG